MRVDDFDFDLPQELIAQAPARPRDSARLLHIGDGLADCGITDLPDLFSPGDILVFNNTKVIPSRLFGKRGDANVEVTLHKQATPNAWWAFARPAKRLKTGDRLVFAEDFACDVTDKRDGGEALLSFETSADLYAGLDKYGHMPLPPYIKREKNGIFGNDRRDYQTTFAAVDGAVAAPTAGLHFTPDLLEALAARGVAKTFVTLHVGAGTFLPVKVDDTDDHVMHAEWGEVDNIAAATINMVKEAGNQVIAVGSTSLRLLESAADEAGELHPYTGETNIFITPGYDFRIVDKMLTNFHLPRSTLYMLVSAFAGMETMRQAYEHAIAEKYRFFSYGDACLLERQQP